MLVGCWVVVNSSFLEETKRTSPARALFKTPEKPVADTLSPDNANEDLIIPFEITPPRVPGSRYAQPILSLPQCFVSLVLLNDQPDSLFLSSGVDLFVRPSTDSNKMKDLATSFRQTFGQLMDSDPTSVSADGETFPNSPKPREVRIPVHHRTISTDAPGKAMGG